MYKSSHIISESVSNNAFSYLQRKKNLSASPQLYVANIVPGALTDIQIGNETVFEDYEGDNLRSCRGLKHFIKTTFSKSNAPVYIFDNHNHAFYFWHCERNRGTIRQGIPLIHIDQHKDTRQPSEFISEQESIDDEKLFHYTNSVLNVGNFIPPAIKTGLISEIINIDSEQSLHITSKKIPKQFILDIDIDFFAPEMDYIDKSKKMAIIKQLIPLANIITVATSPFFIDQQKAIQLIHEIFS